VIKHYFTKQFLGFLAVGGLAAFLHWLSRIVLSIWLPFSWAVALAYAVGMVVAFALNSFFVFPKSEKPRHKQARDFVIVNLAFFPMVWLASMALNNALQALGMLYYAQAVAHGIAVTLPMFATFLIYKFFAFKDAIHGRP
jgi:putative flippase GtrA